MSCECLRAVRWRTGFAKLRCLVQKLKSPTSSDLGIRWCASETKLKDLALDRRGPTRTLDRYRMRQSHLKTFFAGDIGNGPLERAPQNKAFNRSWKGFAHFALIFSRPGAKRKGPSLWRGTLRQSIVCAGEKGLGGGGGGDRTLYSGLIPWGLS